MSDIVRIKIKGKGLKAKLPSTDGSDLADYADSEESYKRELDHYFQKGYEEGYASAQQELEQGFNQEILEKSQEFYNILSNFEEKLIEYEESFGKIVINVAGRIAEKILKFELEDKSKIEETIGEALRKVIGANGVVIKINPADFSKIEQRDEKIPLLSNFSKLRFDQDPAIEIGGCIIETEIGNVDARISSQINELLKQLELRLSNENE